MGTVLVLPDSFVGPPVYGEIFASEAGVAPGLYQSSSFPGSPFDLSIDAAVVAPAQLPDVQSRFVSPFGVAAAPPASSSTALWLAAAVAVVGLVFVARRGA
jgi:hypothetical protein